MNFLLVIKIEFFCNSPKIFVNSVSTSGQKCMRMIHLFYNKSKFKVNICLTEKEIKTVDIFSLGRYKGTVSHFIHLKPKKQNFALYRTDVDST